MSSCIEYERIGRDCNVFPDDGDNTCIDKELIFSYHVMEKISGKSTEELNELSFLPINNCFHNISFGSTAQPCIHIQENCILHHSLIVKIKPRANIFMSL